MIVIYGASGHGKVIADIIIANNPQSQIVFIDDADKGENFYNFPVYHTKNFNLENQSVVLGIGNNLIRKKIATHNYNFQTLIHPSAIISDTVKIEKGTVVMANVSCNADSIIGKHTILNTSCSIDHDCEIGDFAHISPNASLAGNVIVGEGAHIGIGASILQGIKIGKFATVGAGSVVIEDVPNGATVVGCPAKIIKVKNELL